MAEYMLPASPSWYCSRVIDSNNMGLTCFGAKHSIYIVDTVSDPPKFKGRIPAHHDRVVGVSFCPHADQLKLASVSEDGKVKIWDLRDNSLCGEHTEHKYKLTSVHWSPVNADLIVSGDEKGGLIAWQPSSGELKTFSPEPNCIFCLTCSPHVANQVAIGYKNGQVLVVDIGRKGNSVIIQKLRGHDDEIHSVVWCPQPGGNLQQGSSAQWRRKDWDAPVEDEPRENTVDDSDYLVATGSRDKTIRVWSMNRGKPIHFFKLPPPSGQRRGWDDSRQRVWLTLYWPKQRPGEIISSSFNGDLLLWDLVRPGKLRAQPFTGTSGQRIHTRIVFNIAAAGLDGTGICSVSMDRNIILWDAETLSASHSIPSLGGFVYCLAQSPIHSGRIATGVGDNLIRVWNVENTSRPYDVNVFWQGIKSKVTAVSWHPKKESHLAFGTDDGKVGILDILSSRSFGSSTYHKRTVYVVAWGPPSYNTDEAAPDMDYALYSCGDCVVLQHNPSKLEDNARDIGNIIRLTNGIKGKLPGRSEISWKPDYSLMALGNEDGIIEVFKAPNLQLLCSVQVHRKLVNCVRWHPEYTSESVEPSQCQFWIASGSNEAVIQVTDIRKAIESSDQDTGRTQMVVTESFCQLEGHTNRITGLSWSPHKEGLLTSACYDWTAQVWDVKACEPIANYRAHHGRLLCTLWSALDPDIIYTGGDDFSAQGWKISQQTHKAPPVGSEKRKHKNKNKGKHNIKHSPDPKPAVKADQSESPTVITVDPNAMGDVALAEIQALLDKKKAELVQAAEEAAVVASSVNGADQVPETSEGSHLEPAASEQTYPKPIDSTPTKRDALKRDLKDKTKRKTRSLFPLSSTMDNRGKLHTQDDCVHLIQAKAQDPVPLLPADQSHLGHFMDRKNAYQLFDQEIDHHMDQGNWDQYLILETFRGNTADSVHTVTEKRELNDFTVSLSAMASPAVWRATCQAYAVQLEKDGNYPKAASYLLAIHQVYEAIELLRRNAHYKDALCLARVRLSPEDPVIRSLYSGWGYQLASDGNFELAAKCFIGNGQPLEAARLLARRADVSALRVASEICIGCHDMTNAKIYCHKFVQQCMLNLDWAGAAQLVKMDESLKINGLLLTTHQSLLQQLHLLGYVRDLDVEKGEPYTVKPPVPDDSSQPTLPWLLLNTSDLKSWLPWQPYTVEGEVFFHHLIRQWSCMWQLDMGRDELERLDQELTTLSHTRQAHTASKQILIEITCRVTLATVKFLLGQEEDAAQCLTIAMAMCHDNQLDDLWEGICRLLLPAGAARFGQLCQGMRVMRLSAISQETIDIDQVVSSKHEITSSQALDSDPSHIYNSSEQCSAVECLEAFYNLRVLKFYLDKCDHPGQKGDLLSASRPEVCSEPSVMCVWDISHSLLWDAQILKLKLQETLTQISKATAALISQHGVNQSETGSCLLPKIDCDVPEPLIYPVTPDIRNVSLAAFQKENELIMARIGSPQSTSTRPLLSLNNLGDQPLPQHQDSDEYVKMNNVQDDNGDNSLNVSGISGMGDARNGTSVDADENNTSINDNQIPTETAVTSSSSTASKDSSPQHLTVNVDIPEVDKLGRRYQIYPNIPEEWYILPIQDKYSESYVSLMVLTMEQAFTQNELSRLSLNVKNIPFPNPEDSARLLTRLSGLCDKGDQLQAAIKGWARQHCYTNNAIKFFR